MINDNNVLLKKITEKKEEKKQKCHQMNLLGRFYCAARFSWASILSTLTKLDMQHKYYFLKELRNFFSFFFCFVSFRLVLLCQPSYAIKCSIQTQKANANSFAFSVWSNLKSCVHICCPWALLASIWFRFEYIRYESTRRDEKLSTRKNCKIWNVKLRPFIRH